MKSIKVNAIANIFLKILNIVFPLITTPYITRLLEVKDFAEFNVANTYINLFVPLAAFGIYNYGVRELSNVKTDSSKINLVYSKLFYTGILSAFITYIVYYLFILLNGNYNNKLYIILGFQILFQFLYVEWVNEALENYTFILYKTLFVRIIMLLSIFIFVNDESDIIPYTVIMTIFTILNFLFSFVHISSKVKLVKVNILDIIFTMKVLFPVFLLANVNMLYTVLDRFFLTYSKVSVEITYYILAQTVVSVITGVIIGAIAVNIPRYGYYLGNGDKSKYEDLLNKSSRYFMMLVSPMSMGIIILGKYIMFVAFGSSYYDSYILSIFGIRTFFFAIEIILGQHIIFTNGFENKLTKIYFLGGIINLFLNMLLLMIDYMDAENLLITTLISELFVIFLEIVFITKLKILHIKDLLINSIRYFIFSVSFIVVYIMLSFIFRPKFEMGIALYLFIISFVISCVLVYIIILYLIKDEFFLKIPYVTKVLVFLGRNNGDTKK